MASIFLGSFALQTQTATALTATNNTLNFQARLQTASGAVVPDGFYNIQFKLYDGGTAGGPAGQGAANAGTLLWTETWYDSNGATTGNDNRVKVVNGYISANLGSLTAFSGINWDQNLWLTMNIGGTTPTATPTYDGEMNPRLKLTGVPYAFRAGQLAQYNSTTGFTSTLSILQPTVGNQSFQIADQGAAGTYTLCVQNSTSCGFAASTGSNGYIQNSTGGPQTANFNIQSAAIGSVTGVLRAMSGQTADVLQVKDVNGNDALRIAPNGVSYLGSNGVTVRIGKTSGTVASATNLAVVSTAAGNVAQIIRGTTSQTGNLLELQNDNTDVLAKFDKDGNLTAPTVNTTTGFNTGAGTGTQRLDSSGNLLNIFNATMNGSLQQTGTGAINYLMGGLGLGTANPQSGGALTIANGKWISAADALGTGYINMFQVNSSNQIQVGAALNVDGGIVLPTNGGQMTLVDLGIDSTAAAGAKQSYSLRVGSANALTVYGEADGAGNAQNLRVAIGQSIAPAYTLDVAGDINASTVYRVGGTIGATTACTGGQVLTNQVVQGGIVTGGTCAAGGAGGSFVNLQAATPGIAQTGHFNITGTGIAGALQATTAYATSSLSVGVASTTYGLTVQRAGAQVALFQSTGANVAFIDINNVQGSQQTGINIQDAGTTKYQIGKQGNNTFYIYDNANARDAMRIIANGDVILQPSAGNVGIGTLTTGSYKLNVAGDINTSSNLRTGDAIRLDNAGNLTSITSINGQALGSTTICLSSGNCGTGGSGNYINNGTSIQNANFNIDGVGTIGTGLIVGAGVFGSGAVTTTGPITFDAKVNYIAGDAAIEINSADFNGDGKPDLATVNRNANTVSVLMNNGDGTFATKVDYTTGSGSGPTEIVAADFSGDGKADVATANKTTGLISVFINNGNGTLAAKVDYTGGTANNITGLIAADFTNDGKADLVVADTVMYILKNNGSGTFAARTSISGTSGAGRVTTGDINSDGNLDLVYTGSNSGNNLFTMAGNGSGGFSAMGSYAVTSSGSLVDVAMGDFNGDNKTDIVTANTPGDNTVAVLLNNGFGTFYAPANHTATNTGKVSATDLTGDGKAEIIVTNVSTNTVSVLENNGSAVFGTPITYVVNAHPDGLAMRDYNADGKIDIAVAHSYTDSVNVLLNTTTVTTTPGSGTNAKLSVVGSASGVAGMIIQGASGQTANILQAQDSSGNILLAITASGALDTAAGGTLNMGTVNAAIINVGTNAAAHAINIGTGTGDQDIIIGATNSSSSITLKVGAGTSGGDFTVIGATTSNYKLGTTGGTGTITLGQSTATNTVEIGNNTTAAGNTQTVNIATQSTSTGKTAVNIGSLNGASFTNIQAGTGGINLLTNNASIGTVVKSLVSSAAAFQVQDASSNAIFTVDTSYGGRLIIGDATNGVLITEYGVSLEGNAQSAGEIALQAEYAGAVLDAQSDSACVSANNGTMTSGYDGINNTSFYNWTSSSTTAQCYDVVVRIHVPSGASFSTVKATALRVMAKTSSTANSSIAIQILDTDGEVDTNYNYQNLGMSTAWSDVATAGLTGAYDSTSNLTLKIRLSAKNGANVQLGDLTMYYSKTML